MVPDQADAHSNKMRSKRLQFHHSNLRHDISHFFCRSVIILPRLQLLQFSRLGSFKSFPFQVPSDMKPEFVAPQMSSSSLSRLNGNNRCMKNFHRRYLTLCRAKNYQPLSEIVGTGGGGATARKVRADSCWKTVDFYGDRFKEIDWQLISDALREDSSLELLAIRLRKVLNEGECE